MTNPTAYGLYRTDPNLIEMIADTRDLALTYKTMFGGPRWKIRRLTPEETRVPFVVEELAKLAARRAEMEAPHR